MSEAPAAEEALALGGHARLGFAVPMRHVQRIVGTADLPERHRRASLPLLFEGPPGRPEATRYAQVAQDTYLELGPEVRVHAVAPSERQDLPAFLTRSGARWGWGGLVHALGRVWILVDVGAVATLAAPRQATAGSVGSEAPPAGARP